MTIIQTPAIKTPARGAAPSVNGFRLIGPSITLDPRINAYRPDLADFALAGRVIAAHYARPHSVRCLLPNTAIRAAPAHDARAVSELLAGEAFALLESYCGWAWGYSQHDHYVGYVRADALGDSSPPTHKVMSGAALIFAEPDIKSALIRRLPVFAQLSATPHDDHFLKVADGFLHRRHAGEIDKAPLDPVTVAERLIGTPYLWGGRSGDGLDCSGLVQQALAAAGIASPRDSDQQQALGTPIGDPSALRRGDLVFFPGHVGLMSDAEHLVHANAYWMAVTREPLADVVARLADRHAQPIIAMRRPKS